MGELENLNQNLNQNLNKVLQQNAALDRSIKDKDDNIKALNDEVNKIREAYGELKSKMAKLQNDYNFMCAKVSDLENAKKALEMDKDSLEYELHLRDQSLLVKDQRILELESFLKQEQFLNYDKDQTLSYKDEELSSLRLQSKVTQAELETALHEALGEISQYKKDTACH
jgi:chromosome segregation ATPase